MKRLIATIEKLLDGGSFHISAIELDRYGETEIDGEEFEVELRSALEDAKNELGKSDDLKVTSFTDRAVIAEAKSEGTKLDGRSAEIYYTLSLGNNNLAFVKAFLDFEGIRYTETLKDYKEIVKVTKGQVSPQQACIVRLGFTDQMFTSPYALIEFIQAQGLIRC